MTPRRRLVRAAHWAVANRRGFTYTEGPERMSYLFRRPWAKPVATDCSGFVRWCYWVAGCPDPMGLGYRVPEGYTGTLLSHGREILRRQVHVGDLIVYGPGTGEHTAIIVSLADPLNPLTVSMGQEGDPSFVSVNEDGRTPQRYLRFPTFSLRIGR